MPLTKTKLNFSETSFILASGSVCMVWTFMRDLVIPIRFAKYKRKTKSTMSICYVQLRAAETKWMQTQS